MIITSGLSIRKVKTAGTLEPVTLDEVKAHLRIDFIEHDATLTALVIEAREEVEKYTGLSLVNSDVTAQWATLSTDELPYGPVLQIVSGADDYTITGLDYPSIKAESAEQVEVAYKTGWPLESNIPQIPAGLKLAIMKLVAVNFDEEIVDGPGSDWKSSAKRYSRKTWLG